MERMTHKMKPRIFKTREEAEAIYVAVRVFGPEHQEVWLHTASNRQLVGTYDKSGDADLAATKALITACYDFDGPFDPNGWNDIVEAIYAVNLENTRDNLNIAASNHN